MGNRKKKAVNLNKIFKRTLDLKDGRKRIEISGRGLEVLKEQRGSLERLQEVAGKHWINVARGLESRGFITLTKSGFRITGDGKVVVRGFEVV